MKLTKIQIIVLLAFLGLFFVMWKGCETKSQNIRLSEKSRAATFESTGVENLMIVARKALPTDRTALIDALAQQLEKVGSDTSQSINILKKISALWFESGHPSIAGHYADQIAGIKKDENSWAMSGTTYLLCMKQTTDPTIKDFCYKRGVTAFENAISLSPENVDHRIHLALCHVENPPAAEPMRGILMLRDLNTKYPKNVSVLNQLARLALKTNQIPKALERLNQAIELENGNMTTICLLAEAYTLSGDQAKAAQYNAKCK